MAVPAAVAAVAKEGAKAVAQAGFKWLATKVYEQNKPLCGEGGANTAYLPPIEKAFCLFWRAQADAANTEWKAQLQSEVTRIGQTLDRVNHNVDIINNNVNRLLREMALLHLEIKEATIGATAYNAIQQIRVYYGDFLTRIKNLPEAPIGDNQATLFFGKVLHEATLQYQIDLVSNALVDSLAGKECLLRVIASQIAEKADGRSLVDCYQLYEQYVNSILIDLQRANLVIEAAVLYFEVLAQKPVDPKPKAPPFTTTQWKARWNAQLVRLLDSFNSHLEWLILTRYTDAARDIKPFFLPSDARWVFWCADAFCSGYFKEYGLRGRILSMGGQFDGNLRLKGGTTASGKKFEVQVGKKIDYWTATKPGAPQVYDRIDFSDTWTVHRFHFPVGDPAVKEIETALPYSPPPIPIEPLEIDGDAKPAFGSFVEIARAGGGFAFFSGSWDLGNGDKDLSNLYEGVAPGVSKATERRTLTEHVIRDGSLILAKVKRPEVGVAKGGWVHFGIYVIGTPGAPKDASHLRGSFRTWLQTAKTIKFQAMSNEHIKMTVVLSGSLEPLIDFPGAATLNGWLNKGNRTKADLTDAQILSKQIIAGANYDPTLAVPDSGCRVQGGINVIPISEGWEFEQAGKTAYWQICQGTAACEPRQIGLFREGEAGSRTASFRLPYVPASGLKFRFQAFYDLSIETSGLNETPFAVCVRGALDNIYFELSPGQVGVRAPQNLQGILKWAECRCFAFDYDGTGLLDHVAAYDPGSNNIAVFGQDGSNRFAQRSFVWGEMGYDYIKNGADRAFAFDWNGNRGPDHVIFHRPSTGRLCVVNNNAGVFSHIHDQSIQLPDPADRAITFDYNGTGRSDHLVIYRPGGGKFTLLNKDGAFSHVYENSRGISLGKSLDSGYVDLSGPGDRIFAFDYESSGKLDHLVIYRPGGQKVWIVRKQIYGHTFARVHESSSGLGGFDLRNPADRALAFDYDGSGKPDHIVFYRPGKGAIFIVKKDNAGNFVSVYSQGDPGGGIGGYDLKSPTDRVLAFDYSGSGKSDHLMLYRPGTGIFWVIKRNENKTFSRVFPA